ncbi:hypothetical protein HDE_01602 [Halotydeus destructor]|nr:hypothetical protein HDE_01602 [Halotydeus destructor]
MMRSSLMALLLFALFSVSAGEDEIHLLDGKLLDPVKTAEDVYLMDLGAEMYLSFGEVFGGVNMTHPTRVDSTRAGKLWGFNVYIRDVRFNISGVFGWAGSNSYHPFGPCEVQIRSIIFHVAVMNPGLIILADGSGVLEHLPDSAKLRRMDSIGDKNFYGDRDFFSLHYCNDVIRKAIGKRLPDRFHDQLMDYGSFLSKALHEQLLLLLPKARVL